MSNQSEICALLNELEQVIRGAKTIYGCGQGPAPNGGECQMPERPEAQTFLGASTVTEYVCGLLTRWQGYDPVKVLIDPTLEARGIGGYNDPENRILAVNSDDLFYKVAGVIENWRIMDVEMWELVTRHTENDWWTPEIENQYGRATGRTYLISERGHRRQFFDEKALPQAGAQQ